MTRAWLPGLLGLMLLAGGSAFGADQPTTTNKAETKTETKKAVKHKHTANKPVAPEGATTAAMSAGQSKQAQKTHLPAHFAKLSMTPEQHQKALAVMDRYASQIKLLESQIHDLRAKRDGELTALLSDTQKKTLAEAKTNSKKASAEKKVAAGKTMAVTGHGFQFDPKELKALHDQAEQNLAIRNGRPAGEPAAIVKKAKHGKAKSDESKDQTKKPASTEKTPAEKTQPETTQPEKK
jgi:hypothetical protein